MGPAWSIWLPYFCPPLSSFCALFEIKLRFSSKVNDKREKKKKSHPGLKSGSFLQLTSCFCQGGSSVCPQLTLACHALCKWEAVSMSACLRPFSKKERKKEKQKTHVTTTQTPQDQLIPVDWSKAGGLCGGASCLPFKLSTPMPITSLMTHTQLWKKSGVTRNSKHLQDNFSNLWSLGMLFF